MRLWVKKYFRATQKEKALQDIQEHIELIERTDEALRRYEKASMDGEERWFECEFNEMKIQKDDKNDSFSGTARAHCRP